MNLDAPNLKVVYKKLLGMQPTFQDLEDAQPSLAKGLKQLLDFGGDVEATFCRCGKIHVPVVCCVSTWLASEGRFR